MWKISGYYFRAFFRFYSLFDEDRLWMARMESMQVAVQEITDNWEKVERNRKIISDHRPFSISHRYYEIYRKKAFVYSPKAEGYQWDMTDRWRK